MVEIRPTVGTAAALAEVAARASPRTMGIQAPLPTATPSSRERTAVTDPRVSRATRAILPQALSAHSTVEMVEAVMRSEVSAKPAEILSQ